MQMTKKEYDALMKDLERMHKKVTRSKKAAKQFLVALGLMTPTGRPSRAKPGPIKKSLMP
jgi:hypothetical protein